MDDDTVVEWTRGGGWSVRWRGREVKRQPVRALLAAFVMLFAPVWPARKQGGVTRG